MRGNIKYKIHSCTHLPAVLGSKDPQQNDEKEGREQIGNEVPPGDVGAGPLVVPLGPVEFLAVLFRFFQIGFRLIELALESFHRSDRTLVGVLSVHEVVRQEIDDQLPDPDRHNDA